MITSTWFLLYGGFSEDGRSNGCGPGTYLGRTICKTEAQAHEKKCRKDPYCIGGVEVITDTKRERANPQTNWSAL